MPAKAKPRAGHTTGGWPYVQGADALTDFPALSLELANKLEAAPTWNAIPNGAATPGFATANWQNHASFPVGYSRDAFGIVRMRGACQWIQGVQPGNGSNILVLPAAYAPPVTVVALHVWAQIDGVAQGVARVDVYASGALGIGLINMNPAVGTWTGVYLGLGALSWSTK
jgi:hypothetical protein